MEMMITGKLFGYCRLPNQHANDVGQLAKEADPPVSRAKSTAHKYYFECMKIDVRG